MLLKMYAINRYILLTSMRLSGDHCSFIYYYVDVGKVMIIICLTDAMRRQECLTIYTVTIAVYTTQNVHTFQNQYT